MGSAESFNQPATLGEFTPEQLVAAGLTPTIDRDELVGEIDRIMDAQRERRGDMMTYGQPDPWLPRIKARIQADAATIAGMREALTEIAEGDWSDKRWQAEHATRQIARAALKGGDHG